MNKVIKNLFSLISGQIFVLAINFISITISARYLGVEDFGKFSSILAITILVSKAFEFGFGPIVFRELSLKKDYSILNSSIILTVILFIITTLIFNLILLITQTSTLQILLLNLMLINSIISSKFYNLRELIHIPFKANLKMQIPMIVAVIDNLLFLVLVLMMPIFNGGLVYFIIVYAISNIPGFILILFFLFKKFNYKFSFEFKNVKWLLKESLPIWGYILLDIIYQQFDIIMLNYFKSDYEVGIFSASIRIVFPLLIIPSSIVQTVLPKIAQNLNSSKLENSFIIKLTYKILIIISIFFASIFAFKSTEIIEIIFGNKYIDADKTVTVLFFSQIFFYVNFFTVNLFITYKQQRWNLYYVIILVVINILLNFILIPTYSYLGVGIAKLIAVIFGFVFLLYILIKIKEELISSKLNIFLWILFLFFAFYLYSNFSIIVYLFSATATLFISIYLFRIFNKIENDYLYSILKKMNYK